MLLFNHFSSHVSQETGQGAIGSETSACYKRAQTCLVSTRHIRNKWSRERACVVLNSSLVSRFSVSVNLECNSPLCCQDDLEVIGQEVGNVREYDVWRQWSR